MESTDIALFRIINTQWTCAFMDILARAFQHSWPGILLGLCVAAFLFFKDGRRGAIVAMACVIAVILTDVTCSAVLKPLVARIRPSATLDGARLLLGKKGGFGFPSNHAANWAAMTCVLGASYPRWAWIPASTALLIGYSRIYAGVHYPSDVLGGYLAGIVIGMSVYLIAQKRYPQIGARPQKSPHAE
jgi:undecaprenyl-diphosphatase